MFTYSRSKFTFYTWINLEHVDLCLDAIFFTRLLLVVQLLQTKCFSFRVITLHKYSCVILTCLREAAVVLEH